MPSKLVIYWMPEQVCRRAIAELRRGGGTVTGALLTPCQALRATSGTAIHVPPAIWNGMCSRQGSWYRASKRAGQHMLAATAPLSSTFDIYRDVEISASDFRPENLPSETELAQIVAMAAYREQRPDEWEQVKKRDSFLFKAFFTITGFWRKGDNLARHWLGHRANHANFITRRYATKMGSETVAYSVTENAGVCSSCAEFFNVVTPESRKLVRACPGSVTFGGAKRGIYYDVRPYRAAPVNPRSAARGAPEARAESSAR